MMPLSDFYSLRPIGYIHSPYKQKFGVARQPGLVPAATMRLTLLPEFTADCVRGLTQYNYVWIEFIFHAVLNEGWLPLIRPPKLGGKKKMGVFATRSPHRPNHIGLSLLKLEKVDTHPAVTLHLSGGDLLDKTPVLDIKPYVSFVEAKPEARSGFAQIRPELAVCWEQTALQQLVQQQLDTAYRLLVEQSIAQDPRPAHQRHKDKIFVLFFGCHDVRFRVVENVAYVLSVVPHVEL